ncbi:MAG: tetratricopeptide repeat protein, partial [Planctomycetes bacterium]|nr:tetratricopeptide repeat protein [Planctomycetota bacterium]
APNAVEPRQNLGVLYESLGRLPRATAEYESALEIDPNSVVTMRYLARAYVKSDENKKSLKQLLNKLLGIPQTHEWDEWLRGQVIRLGRSADENQSDLVR